MRPASLRESASTALQPAPRAKHAGLIALLLDHHAEMEASCLELMGAAFVDDPPTLARRWRTFEHEVLNHMAAEEELLIPSYQLTAPEQAQELRADHILLRDMLERMALDVELHAVRIGRLAELVGLLRAHAHREQMTLYPWAQRHLSTVLRQRLVTRISRTLRHRGTWDELHSA